MRWLLSYPEEGPSSAFYRRWVRAAGAEPTWVSATYDPPGDLLPFHALLLPGGGDVDPARYREPTRHAATQGVLPGRDQLEADLVAAFQAMGRPVFGICRGMQMVNVARGGCLLQHLPDVVAAEREPHSAPDRDVQHPLLVEPDTRLGAVLRAAREVNSSHHQAADPTRLGRGLRVAARSGAGIIEALESEDGGAPVLAVQWHPERLPMEHPASRALRELWAELSRP